ncbi:MAG: DNA topoisomerase (ATP-hydrolyzing), partial [Kiritimatiellia bacterium]
MDEDTTLNNGNIRPIHIEEEMSTSYIDYSMSVIAGRALPDARDGLKPVHRRVLFAMRELGNTHNRPYKKSARVVGDVIGKYHPHGDTAVYDTIVRMAQDWAMRAPLVDGQGNFGSRDGDAAAAMRYTEVRMHRHAEELLEDIDKETVDFGPNYDESLTQPLVLPAKLPNLLLNGSTGIAVGMATNIPPHNLGELVDGILHFIDHPDCTVDDLMQFIQGPDFPTAGQICGMAPIRQMYQTGRGLIRIRGKARVEDMKADRERIVIDELPYNVNKAKLIENIAHLVQNKLIEGISDLRDESNSREPVRIIVELKKSVIADVVLNNLFKHTQLQTTFGAIMLALDGGQPKVMNLVDILRCFVNHRFEVVTRRTQFELSKAEARAHILEGLRIALDNLDEIVRTIRQAPDRENARLTLMSRFALSDLQARAILDMRLYQLTGLERDKVEQEYATIMERITFLRALLADKTLIFGVIKDELIEAKDKYADPRRTEIA